MLFLENQETRVSQHKAKANQLPALLFLRRDLFSSDIGVLPPLSEAETEAFPGVSTVTRGVPTLVGAFVAVPAAVVDDGCACLVAVAVVLSTSPDRDNIKDPGSPTNGFSSMNSSPYRERRLNDSASALVSCTLEPTLLVVAGPVVDVEVACDPIRGALVCESASGMGVFSSLLCWDCMAVWLASIGRGAGGI